MGPDLTRPLVQTTTTDAVTDDGATSTTESSTSESSPPRSSSSSSPPPPIRPSIQSDSGVTHTIPNDSTVTVTRHTTITRELPSTSTDSPAPTTAEPGTDAPASSSIVDAPLPTNRPVPNPDATQPPGNINTAAVAGIAVGGVLAAAALLAVVFWLWKRRRNRAAEEEAEGDINEPAVVDKARLRDSIFGRRPTPPSLPRHSTPHQASHQGYGYDPFAPFGGRADQPAGQSPPPLPDTFEMDGRGIHVVELPGTAVAMANSVPSDSPRRGVGARSVGAVKQRPSSDPRATLNHLPRQNGRPTYINQWNQYKVLSGEIHPRGK